MSLSTSIDTPTRIPIALDSLALRRLADSQERTADALEAILDLMKKQADGTIQKKAYYGEKKPPEVWVACAKEGILRIKDRMEKPFLDWEDVKEQPTFREGANMKREYQFRRFIKQHAIPHTPEYGDVHLVGIGEEDKNHNGPPACTIEGWTHCAYRAFKKVPDNAEIGDSGPIFDPKCGLCKLKKEREAIEKAIRDRAKLEALDEALLDPTLEPRQRERMESDRRWLSRDLKAGEG